MFGNCLDESKTFHSDHRAKSKLILIELVMEKVGEQSFFETRRGGAAI